ncbi:MAG: TetR/AcrR family transcriptional regulator [Planctomycetes bacterium]|nr:TetR/AcrR family transcriptional regulator [Planctomycetota bacterium]
MPRRDRRREIMAAAERLFTSRRYHELTTDDIAAAARVGKGTIYRYFKDKEDLFFQVATSGFDEMCELLNRKVPEGAPFGEQLLSACSEIPRFFERRRQLFRMMQAEDDRMQWCSEAMRDRWTERRKGLVAAVAAILQKGVHEGAVRADVPPELLANFLLGLLRTRGRDLADAPPRLRRDELIVDLFTRGAGRFSGNEVMR